jgi:DNA-binding GntR family transcriptional regulator
MKTEGFETNYLFPLNPGEIFLSKGLDMSQTNADRAYALIKDKIVRVEMPPGSIIREVDLMNDLNLGRTPIREALKRLQADNLVVVKAWRGIFVTDIAITDLTQIYEVRVELEGLCVRLATNRVTPAQLSEIRDLAQEHEQMDQDDLDKLFALDHRFHRMLATASRNKFLFDEIEHFYNLSLRIWYLSLNYVQAENIDVPAHLDILAALEAKDPNLAEQRMREHIRKFHDSIRQYL